jgi:hypothetical protein
LIPLSQPQGRLQGPHARLVASQRWPVPALKTAIPSLLM